MSSPPDEEQGKKRGGQGRFLTYSADETTSSSSPDRVSPLSTKPTMLKRIRQSVVLGKRDMKNRRSSSEGSASTEYTPDVGRSSLLGTSEVLRCRMAERVAEYTVTERHSVFCGTWNVNGKPVSSVEGFLKVDDPLADIYAVGFQELDLRAEALVLNETPREKDWVLAIETALGPSYVQVKVTRLVGMLLVVYVRQDLREQIHGIDAQVCGTGLMRKMGNKGGVAVRFKLNMTSVCFVCSHLAAHLEEVERRNEDYHDILARITFDDDSCIADHDLLMWMGDMNYRLNNIANLDESAIRAMAVQDMPSLFKMDQLLHEQAAGRTFVGFQEGPVLFQPSYKYDAGTDQFDTSEKGRTPAWCDRVLFRGDGIEVVDYRSHMKLQASDHKPVSALLLVPIRKSDAVREKEVFTEELFHMDRMANNMLPNVQLSTLDLVFSDVKFFESPVQYVKVTNTGNVPCHFHFVSKLDDSECLPPWLTVKPASAVLRSGKSTTLTFTVSVRPHLLTPFNRHPSVEKILIFHLESSRDFFINVSVDFRRTLFGRSLSELSVLSQGRPPSSMEPCARSRCLVLSCNSPPSDCSKLLSLDSPLTNTPGSSFAIHLAQQPISTVDDSDHPPRPLWVLVDAIIERGLDTVDLFFQGGRQRELVYIRDAFDDGLYDISEASVRSIAEALLVFLEALPEPVVPCRFHAACLHYCGNRASCREVIENIPMVHQRSFMKLTMMLTLLLNKSGKNLAYRANILSLFSNIVFRPPLESENQKERANREKKCVQFLGYFVQ